jgi:hypothetical protein
MAGMMEFLLLSLPVMDDESLSALCMVNGVFMSMVNDGS